MSGRRVLAGLGVAAAIAFGCSLIVPAEVPEFACTRTGASSCPAGMVCDPTLGQCVTDAGADADPPDGAVADAGGDADADADAGPAPIGSPCRVDGDCASNLCGTDTFLTPTITAGSGPVCTRPCCTSADCPAGAVCFGGGTGGNYCVLAAKAERTTPPKAGGKGPGATCSASTECRSGSCKLSRCLDTCCSASECAAGTTCRVSFFDVPLPVHDGWVCAPAPPAATKDAGDVCKAVDDCKNDNCAGTTDAGPGVEPRVCHPPCCRKSDCASQMPSFPAAQCAYGTSGTDQLKWCFALSNTTGIANNQPCGTNVQCQSSYCDDASGRCLSTCCLDSDCGNEDACRPSPKGFLRCVPR